MTTPDWYPDPEPEGCSGILLGVAIGVGIWLVAFGLLWWWLT